MLDYVIVFLSLLASTSCQNGTQDASQNISQIVDDNQLDPEIASDQEQCYHICPTWLNVIAISIIITLTCCICAAVCQQQPREIFYLVDRSPDDRPPSIPLEPQPLPTTNPKLRSDKSLNSGQQPIVTEPPSPKNESPPGAEDGQSSPVTNSVKIDISVQEPIASSSDLDHTTQLYAAQESIEDEPVPFMPFYTQPSPDEKPIKPTPDISYTRSLSELQPE